MPLATHIRGLNTPILETHDPALQRSVGPPWLCYGSHCFVRKPPRPDGRLGRSEVVHEYSTHTPRPDSKTGEINDDAILTPLMWIADHGMMSKEMRAFAIPGLDRLFREYLFAAQMMNIACRHHEASPDPKTEEAQNVQAVQGGMRTARALSSRALALGLVARRRKGPGDEIRDQSTKPFEIALGAPDDDDMAVGMKSEPMDRPVRPRCLGEHLERHATQLSQQ